MTASTRTARRIAAALLAAGALPVAALAQVTPSMTAATDSARPIALAEAVRLAQRQSPQAVQARGQETVSRAAVRSAYGAFLPNVTVTTGAVRSFTGAGNLTRINPQTGATETLSSQPWSYSNGLGFNVDLFDGRRLFDISAAKANVTAAQASEVAQRFVVALDVKQQYYNVLAARESEAAAEAQLEEATQQLKAASARVAAGVATRSDSLRSLIQVGNAQLALLTAQNGVRTANAALTRLVATPFLVTASTSDTLDQAAAPLDSATLSGLAARGPAVRQALAQLDAARANRRAARAPYLPTISASYARNGSGLDNRYGLGSDPFTYQGSLRLGLSYPIFNQFSREEQIVRARVTEGNAQASLRDARFAAEQTLAQYLGTLGVGEQRVAIQQASVAAAVEDLRVQQQRYNLGASTLLDLLTSQTQLTQARLALIQARYDARVARAQIEALVGQELR